MKNLTRTSFTFTKDHRSRLTEIIGSADGFLHFEKVIRQMVATSGLPSDAKTEERTPKQERAQAGRLATAAERLLTELGKVDPKFHEKLSVFSMRPPDGEGHIFFDQEAGDRDWAQLLSLLDRFATGARQFQRSIEVKTNTMPTWDRHWGPWIIYSLEVNGVPRSCSLGSPMAQAFEVLFEAFNWNRRDAEAFIKTLSKTVPPLPSGNLALLEQVRGLLGGEEVQGG